MPTDFSEIVSFMLEPYMLVAFMFCVIYFLYEKHRREVDGAVMMASIEKHRMDNHPSEPLNFSHMKEWAEMHDSGFNEFLEELEEGIE